MKWRIGSEIARHRAAVTCPSFFDTRSEVEFHFWTPRSRSDLWGSYLAHAAATYRSFGVEAALELSSTRDGKSTSLFVVGVEPSGDVVAGVRFQGPISTPEEAHVSLEFAGSPGEEAVRSALCVRVPHGVVEFKAGWVQVGHPQGDVLADAIARSFVHGMRLLGARFGCCSAATYATRRWESTGGQVMSGLQPVPYPDDRYQTTLLWWSEDTLAVDADPRQWQRIQREWAQMHNAGMTAPELVGASA